MDNGGCRDKIAESVMTDRETFLAALAANEDDEITRAVYADWLDENGEHEEAERQRKWPAAKKWLVEFAAEHNRGEVDDEYPDYETDMSYPELMRKAAAAVREHPTAPCISCGNNMDMCDALRAHKEEFWRNWSVVSGVPVSADTADVSSFSCGC